MIGVYKQLPAGVSLLTGEPAARHVDRLLPCATATGHVRVSPDG
jgi:hypothetical protein